ncbi:MAG: methyltransferase domain-containing protein [Actinomycetota bacterium]|nr:methyltransferase domain-containing protein [Actinomycetota bacterium]
MGPDPYAVQARFYDLVVEPLNAPFRSAARRVLPPRSEWTVLDVGCGTGAALAEYAEAGCRVIGADPSPAMIAQARGRLGVDADLRAIEGPNLPVDDASVDLVLVSFVLHSVPHDDAVGLLREAARVLVAGGRILVLDFGTSGLRFPRGWLGRGVTAMAEIAAGPRHAANSLNYLRRGGLPALVAEAGLDALAVRPTAGGSITIAVLARTAGRPTG